MRIRIFPRTILGLAIVVAIISGVVTVVLGATTVLLVHWELERQLDQRIEVETHALLDYYNSHGFAALARVVELRDQRSGTGDTGYLAGVDEAGRSTGYILIDVHGRRSAGSLVAAMPRPGWSEFLRFQRPDGTTGTAQAMNSALAGGGRLVVAADRSVIDQMHTKILRLFAAGYGVLLVLGAIAAIGFGRIVRNRLMAIETSAEAIMAGDLSRRMPLDGSGGEFDRLSLVLNRMLDRIGDLLDNLRQVSGDIAHDLRTPLSRIRSRLEAAEQAAAGSSQQTLLAAAIRETDDLLDLFSALLAISEIEGQSVRSRFQPVDLGGAVEEIVEAYRPATDEAGMTIAVDASAISVLGDRKLLQRCLANLLDNALTHTPRGTHIRVAIRQDGDKAEILFADDGPGIPDAEHARMFRRLTRLDRSRSTPGHGLGLNMVAAIVGAHGGTVEILPIATGLAIRIVLARSPRAAGTIHASAT